jgi:hypothetical protein
MSTASLFERTIGYSPVVARWLGDVRAAIFLSQAMYWRGKSSHHKTSFYKTQDEWEEETALSKYAQRKAREILGERDWWIENRKGVPAKLWYDIGVEAMENEFREWQKSQRDGDSASFGTVEKLESARCQNKSCDGAETNTETTSENTSSTTTKREREQYDSEPFDRNGREPIDEEDAYDQPAFVEAWDKVHGERLITHSNLQRDHARQQALNHIRTYFTRDEVVKAFNASKQKDRPWQYFIACLKAIAGDEWDKNNRDAPNDGMALFDEVANEGAQ